MLKLKPVTKEEKELFWNINQKYLYEMTKFYPDEIDDKGNYHYGHFDEYFFEPNRKAFFIQNDDIVIGFVMLNNYSYLNQKVDYVIGEFTIFPSYRRKHYALDVINLIFNAYQGIWEIKYNEKNLPAKKLWNKVCNKYNPKIYRLNEFETVLQFNN